VRVVETLAGSGKARSSAPATEVHPKASRSAGDSRAPGLGGGSLLGVRAAWASAGPTPLGRDPSSIQCLIGCDPRSASASVANPSIVWRVPFGYRHADPTRTAIGGHNEGRGVCRDFAHLAITLCRCMNIPARYCTGYLGDIGIPPVDAPMDFSAWFEVYLGGHWHTFDARHNAPRIGRILMARGRDATDVALSTIFGPSLLKLPSRCVVQLPVR
jgi:hypothetical protein